MKLDASSKAPQQNSVVTRFAPSPTGFLHIGGARTALFNWLFSRRHGGRFHLRIEDTDRARSTREATAAIFDGMKWLGLSWDGEAVSQFARRDRHAAIAAEMLASGNAYRCYATKQEIDAARELAKASGHSTRFQSPWRDRNQGDEPKDTPFVIRLKAPQTGETKVEDAVQGEVSWQNDTLDDLVLLRSDGTPTYMLAVVVDDHDLGITHVIRGDDHLTNAARQMLIYEAMGWDAPVFAHIPLIHGADGAKLSKRHGALGVEAYRDMGYPAEAVRNYLTRLGWSHGDDEFFTTEQAVEWFNLDAIGKAPARFDLAKLDNLSGQHLRAMSVEALLSALDEYLASQRIDAPSGEKRLRVARAADALKERAKTLKHLNELAYFALAERPLRFDDKAAALLDGPARALLARLTPHLRSASEWSGAVLNEIVENFAKIEEVKLGKVAQPVRAALTGRGSSPGAFDVLIALGKDEALARLNDASDQTGDASSRQT